MLINCLKKNCNTIGNLLLIVSLSFFSNPLHSQDYRWDRLGPDGGVIFAIASDKIGNLYIHSDRLYSSSNNGEKWNILDPGFSWLGGIQIIKTDHNDNVYIGAWGVHRSKDYGKNWESLGVDANVTAIAINNQDHLFIGTDGKGLFRSVDDGESWTLQLISESNVEIKSIAIDSSSGNIYVSTNSNIVRSIDNGDNWEQVYSGYSDADNNIVILNTGKILVAHGTGCLISEDNGDSWELSGLIDPESASNDNYWFQGITMNGEGTIYAFNKDNGLFISNDEGDNWNHLPIIGYSNSNSTYFESVLGTNSNYLFALCKAGVSRINNDNNKLEYVNNGVSRPDLLSMVFKHDQEIYTNSNNWGILYHSIDQGNNWQIVPSNSIIGEATNYNDVFCDFVTIDSLERICILTSSSLFHLTEERDSFIRTGSYPILLYDLKDFLVKDDSTYFLSGYGGSSRPSGIFKSTNSGVTWDLIYEGPTEHLGMNSHGDIFAANYTSGGGLLRSNNDGLTWDTISDFGPTFFAITNNDDIISWDNYYEKTFTSSDNGESWIEKSKTFNGAPICFAEDNTGMLYVGTLSDGVFVSSDLGSSWTAMSNGLPTKIIGEGDFSAINSISFDSEGTLFAATFYGIFYLNTAVNISSKNTPFEENKNQNSSFYQSYPNPFTNYTTIKLSDFVHTQKIELIDIHGRIVRSIHNINTNSVTIQRENLPSGIYFIRIHSDDTSVKKVIIR